jgi:hypothetical protein
VEWSTRPVWLTKLTRVPALVMCAVVVMDQT